MDYRNWERMECDDCGLGISIPVCGGVEEGMLGSDVVGTLSDGFRSFFMIQLLPIVDSNW
jgi:hypothetical protein